MYRLTTDVMQSAIENVLRGIEGVDVFFDDVKITAPTDEQHIKRLRAVLQRFKEYDLHINKDKSKFMVSDIEFLGYHVTSEGITKSKHITEGIQNLSRL